MALEILVVDDEADIRDLISGVLNDEGHQTRVAANSDETLAAIADRRPALVVLDIWLQNSTLDGLQLLNVIKERDPSLPVIIISGHGNVETAVAAIKRGAYDFIEKPFQADQLLFAVQRATETERLRRENEQLRERAGIELELTGTSAQITSTQSALRKVAATGSRVFISGAAGSGKEVAARLLHAWSPRANAPFIAIGAASMMPERVEVELFGQESSGEVVKTGLFEQAHGGTLFLDEVGDMPMTTQSKILRVLTEQVFQRVGGARNVKVDVRVISGSTKDLREEISAGRFREDLFYRLNVVPVRMPPLRERREDIAALVDLFIERYSAQRGRPKPKVSSDAMAALQAYDWPGNVRQLRNVIERTVILAPEEDFNEVTLSMLPSEVVAEPARLAPGEAAASIMGTPLREAREAFEREYLRVQIRRFSGNISRTAGFIGMERSALHRKLKALGLADDGRDGDENNSA